MFANFTGELAGLGAAVMWAIASVLYRRLGSNVPPLALNLYKGIVTIAMLLVALVVREELWSAISTRAWVLLLISGIIGIGIGDTAFFATLNRLGERRTVLMAETLAPPMATLIALVFLSEVLPLAAFVGIALTVAGVAWVIVERTPAAPIESSNLKMGIAAGLLAALCQSVGAVLSRAALTQTEVGPLWSSLIRIVGGIILLIFWLPAARIPYFPQSVRSARLWRFIALTTFIGTFMTLVLQQVALQHTPAGVVQTLLATSGLFILPLVAFRGEAVSLRAVFGAVVTIVGVGLLFVAK